MKRANRRLGIFSAVFLATVGYMGYREHTQYLRHVKLRHELTLTEPEPIRPLNPELGDHGALGRMGGPVARHEHTYRMIPVDEAPYKDVENVTVSVQTGHFFGNDFQGLQPNCKLGKTEIRCLYGSDISPDTADALWYHIPSMGGTGSVSRRHPKQLLVGMSMESSEYYPALDKKDFMKAFDVEASYRTCSQVPVFYFDYNAEQVSELFSRPISYEDKVTALVYVNSNCGAKSGRTDIMRKVIGMKDPAIPTHSFGHCDRNMDVKGDFNKLELIRKYKFCVAMENSITKDYVTEKLWQALEAGCVPVYLGPHNVADFLPDPNAIVDYNRLGSPEALIKELERLANNRTAYDEKLAWKFRKWEELSPSFLAMTERSHVKQPHTRCQLCRLILKHRYQPQQFTTCLFNTTWTRDYHVRR